jgi:hypothetical protein
MSEGPVAATRPTKNNRATEIARTLAEFHFLQKQYQFF